MPDNDLGPGFIGPAAFLSIVEACGPGYLAALAATPALSSAELAAPIEQRQAAQRARAASLAIQALLAGAALNIDGAMLVLGTACGAILAQCPLERYQALYDLFQGQFTATLASASLAQRKTIDG
jgi:hypothetical protein